MGQTKLFIRLTGDASNPLVKYDTREVRDKIATDLKKEKETLKKVLQDEFKIQTATENPKDTLLIENDSQKDFIIEFEEPEKDSLQIKPQKSKDKSKKKKNSEKDFIIIWDEENDTIKIN